MPSSLETLRQQYCQLVNETLPDAARSSSYLIRFNHCFARIILDNLFEDCWYNHLQKGGKVPAYKQLTMEQLAKAIRLAQKMVQDPDAAALLNSRSLQWRRQKTRRVER